MKWTRRRVLGGLAVAAAAGPVDRALGQIVDVHFDPPIRDPQRPGYHLLPAKGWMNDPCGPIYWKGEYHMFHQYNPNAAVWGDMNWAHAISPDMVHWKRLELALVPTPGWGDAQGCFTGSAVVRDRKPTFLYTGVQTVPLAEATLSDGHNNFRETQWLAIAQDDDLRTWKKVPHPVIPSPPPGMHVTGFRDPAPWRDGMTWYTLIASGIPKVGGNVLLYRSLNMLAWEYMHPMAQGKWSGVAGTNPVDTGEMWECPDFFPLGRGGKHVLIYSTQGKTIWQTGVLDKATMLFHAEKSGELDYGKGYYAPKTQLDARGNRILWGWLNETRPEAEYSKAGWAGMMSLPRVLTLNGNDLMMEPARQTEMLRFSRNAYPAKLSNTRQEFRCVLQAGASGEALPYRVADPFGTLLEVHSDANQDARTLRVDEASIEMPEQLPAQAGLHVFVDNSVMEIFIDSRFCVTRRFYARTPGKAVATLTVPGEWRVARAESWSMNSIWPG
jgi:beta-fructofuranosidase